MLRIQYTFRRYYIDNKNKKKLNLQEYNIMLYRLHIFQCSAEYHYIDEDLFNMMILLINFSYT